MTIKYQTGDYAFQGLMDNGAQMDTPVNTLAYLVSLVDSPDNPVLELGKAKLVLRWLFDIEEQVMNASELITRQESQYFPKGFYPQTPIMLTLQWSPISAMLERNLKPIALSREDRVRACASGVWEIDKIKSDKSYDECETPEELFWCILNKVSQKAKDRGHFLSVIAKPGWSYKDNIDMPVNLTSVEAEKADRVIWQRTPR